MRGNRTLERLRTGRVVVGGEIASGLERLPLLFARGGLDFAWIDMEHTLLDPERVAATIQCSRLCDVTPIVRVPELRPGLVRQLLDNGAQGIILPFVERPEQAAELVAWCHFHPDGRRGIGAPSLAHDFAAVSLAEHARSSRANVLAAIQVESAAGVAGVAAIAATPGLDLVIVGLADLSVSLGVPGRLADPAVHEALNRVIEACVGAGVSIGVAGVYGLSPEDAYDLRHWCDRGVRFFQVTSDLGVLEDGILASARAARSALACDIEGPSLS
jgi:staphyloferrin B biosynthesis citrate synthase